MNAPREWLDIEAALAGLVGLPYGKLARGPDRFDCWGLVLEVRRRLGLPLPPDIGSGVFDRAQALALFHGARPADWRCGPLVLGGILLAPDAGHAGVYVAGRVLHANERTGVVAWPLAFWSALVGPLECWQPAGGCDG